jgi:chromosome segregation ATPase
MDSQSQKRQQIQNLENALDRLLTNANQVKTSSTQFKEIFSCNEATLQSHLNTFNAEFDAIHEKYTQVDAIFENILVKQSAIMKELSEFDSQFARPEKVYSSSAIEGKDLLEDMNLSIRLTNRYLKDAYSLLTPSFQPPSSLLEHEISTLEHQTVIFTQLQMSLDLLLSLTHLPILTPNENA